VARGFFQENRPDSDPRESIWSVSPGSKALYFSIFTILASIGIGYLVWYEITQRTEDTVYDTIMNITLGLGPIAIGAAAIGVIITEVLRFSMVIAEYFAKKVLEPSLERMRERIRKQAREEGLEQGREQGREEGREEGREVAYAEANAKLQAWNRRRMDAEAQGIPFDEPPPQFS
jgi:hypothetical protein